MNLLQSIPAHLLPIYGGRSHRYCITNYSIESECHEKWPKKVHYKVSARRITFPTVFDHHPAKIIIIVIFPRRKLSSRCVQLIFFHTYPPPTTFMPPMTTYFAFANLSFCHSTERRFARPFACGAIKKEKCCLYS